MRTANLEAAREDAQMLMSDELTAQEVARPKPSIAASGNLRFAPRRGFSLQSGHCFTH